jgi:cytochrome c556
MVSQPPRRPSNAGRYLFLFLLGLVIGVVCAVMALRALQARRDPFPEALMNVMAHQSGALRDSAKANRCTTNDTLPRLQSLRALSNDIESGFPGLRDDARFAAAASGLRAGLDKALAAPPADCTQLAAINERIGEDCKSCHRDFR